MKDWSPRRVFLADAIGALFTSMMLGVVLVQFESYIGIGTSTLFTLSTFVFALFIYSICIYFIKPQKWTVFLKIISALNLSYCVVTLFIVYQLQYRLTLFGNIYFIVEVSLIAIIVYLEWSYSNFYKMKAFEKNE